MAQALTDPSGAFGLQNVSPALLQRWEHLLGPLPPWFRRGLVTHHRDLDTLLQAVEERRPIYIYTGRGPSSRTMHLGHLVPFLFTRYLQTVLRDSHVVVQITDDEKFLFRGLPWADVDANARANILDIRACGLQADRTFIFRNSEYMGTLYPNVLRLQAHITNSQCFATLGIRPEHNIGQTAFCATQAAPVLASSFPQLRLPADALCLVPCGVDQDPFFRLARDVAPKLGCPKPVLLCSAYLPSLKGVAEKMSSTVPDSAIFLSDTPQQIAAKIKKSVSGGRVGREEQEQHGADLAVDVAYQYLRFFLPSDAELDHITRHYGPDPDARPKLMCSAVKQRAIEVVTQVVADLQAARAALGV